MLSINCCLGLGTMTPCHISHISCKGNMQHTGYGNVLSGMIFRNELQLFQSGPKLNHSQGFCHFDEQD